MDSARVTFAGGEDQLSGLLLAPPAARAMYVLAHGAGAGMAHPFLGAITAGLAERGVATLRYQFPYMETKKRRPDPPAIAEAAVAAAAAEAARLLPGIPLFAGGKSFGGRMTSQATAHGLLLGMRGLAFLGFPLHPPGKPSDTRAEHLAAVEIPMLFLQGTRDDFAELSLLEPVVEGLGSLATLHLFPDADHSFHVPARSGRKDGDIRAELLDTLVAWIDRVIADESA
jgi:predicted alpha/beta-hydrolase family hydrolase